jgi:hypothetical protein
MTGPVLLAPKAADCARGEGALETCEGVELCARREHPQFKNRTTTNTIRLTFRQPFTAAWKKLRANI